MSIKATSNSLNYFASYCCVKHYNQKQLGEEWFRFIWQLTVYYEGKEGRNSNRAGTKSQELKQKAWRRAAYGLAPHNVCVFFLSSSFFYLRDLSFKHIDAIYLSIYLSIYLTIFSCLENMYMLCPKRAPEGSRSPETGTTNGLEAPCWFWKLKPGPLEEQRVLTTEPSLLLLR